MEILIVTDSPANGKVLSTRISNNGHVAVWRWGTDAGCKELERRLWSLDMVICCPEQLGNVAQMVQFIEQIDALKSERGYHQKPYTLLLGDRISSDMESRVRIVGGFVIPQATDIRKLLGFIEIFDQQAARDSYRPYILLEHSFSGEKNIFCDEREKLLGISVGYLGPAIPTDQTDKTGVLIDYLCQQKYPKTEEQIWEGILRSRFHWSQLKDGSLSEGGIKMLISRARERLEPGLSAVRAQMKADQVILNVPGHTRMYKINIPVKIVHRPLQNFEMMQ